MRIVTGEEMLSLDKAAIQEYGIPTASLMERAGVEVARSVVRLLEPALSCAGARIHILCGKGNNGGDGMVAARTLANWGARVRVFILGDRQALGAGAAVFARSVERMGIPIHPINERELKKLAYSLRTADVIVDAMLGIGSRETLRPLYAKAVAAVNASERPVIAVDLPTGVDANTGATMGDAVRAARTVTFGLPKLGLLVDPGREYAGTIEVAEVGFPQPLLVDVQIQRTWIRAEEARRMLRPRPDRGHKGTFGRVIAVAGSLGMAGAASLVLRGALRAGAGLVTWAGPRALLDTVQRAVPEATAIPLPGDPDKLCTEGIGRVLGELRAGDVIALGPGIGRGEDVKEAVCHLLAQLDVPAVVDADALNALATLAAEERKALTSDRPRVFTPHPKEAARLLGCESVDVQADRLGSVQRLAEQWGATVLLKGSPTLIHDEAGRLGINSSGDVSLATGGTGDVLTGVVAALMAGGHGPWDAAALAAFLHGRAGELAGAAKSRYATVASDVVNALPAAFREVEA